MQPLIKGLELNLESSNVNKKRNTVSKRDIAVIGMACEFGDSKNIQEFWGSLKQGHDSIRRLSEDRLADMNALRKLNNLPIKNINDEPELAYMDNIDFFDNDFFSITPNEARLMDPNQRILLQNISKTIEDAGYGNEKITGSRTGVFIGFGNDFKEEYKYYIMQAYPELYSMSIPGNVKSILASRISYLLDLKGPSLVVDTACSSSLVATHLACQSIRNEECEMAIAGGIDIRIFQPRLDKVDIGIVSSNSRTRSFDDSSDGSGAGEGVGTILLKPLYKALEDGNHIYGVIKGSASNQDGSSIGITAPNPVAQEEVIVEAWKDARIEPESISYIEAHGSGTKLGDPIEIEGITRAFRKFTDRKQFCAVGSVKTNVGHLGNAAGIAGLIKSVLALQYKQIPPSIHFNFPNRKINFEESPVYVNNMLTSWETDEQPRRCGVSSFGMSGTNCHIILEETPSIFRSDVTNKDDVESSHIFTLTAKSEASLWEYIREYREFDRLEEIDISDLIYTANNCRGHYSHRLAIVIQNLSELKMKIKNMTEFRTNAEVGIYYGYHQIVTEDKANRQPYEYTIEEIKAMAHEALSLQEELKTANAVSVTNIEKLALLYVNGAKVDWEDLYKSSEGKVVSLPTYPFERKRCWLELPTEVSNEMKQEKLKKLSNNSELVEQKLKLILSTVSGINVDEIGLYNDFFEMGFDSILITHLMNYIKDELGIEISLSLFYGELSSPIKLFEYIESRVNLAMTNELQVTGASNNLENPTLETVGDLNIVEGSNLEDIINKQLMIMQSQLELLTKNKVKVVSEVSKPPMYKNQKDTFIPYQRLSDLNDIGREYDSTLSLLLSELPLKTKESKNYAEKNRFHLANNRNVVGFRPKLKELIYPIVVEESNGSKIKDIDGNEYIDITMGFGVNLLGHNDPLSINAIKEELNKGNAIGPMSKLAGEVAALISELTGVERVSFFNSGTEANMVALRIARAYTGKNKIIIFAGSFHGTFDGVLARAKIGESIGSSVPLAPGITPNSIKDVIVLDYNDPRSLQVIKDNATDIAAVLVEPVQSRRPDLQPTEFLHELRKITLEEGIALIFDEIITGFRIHPGGAQKWFGIQADLVTYGKVVGGGMPIGIVAGKEQYMDCIDGGKWNFGDNSYPTNDSKRTFVAGTFCHHPLAMASSLAVLKMMKDNGVEVLNSLNSKTSYLVQELNDYFVKESIPIEVVNFGSLFRFKSSEDIELFYYNLLNNGIYVWEGRNCFLSVSHDDRDIEKILSAAKYSADFLKKVEKNKSEEKFPLSSAQQKIYMIETLKSKGSAYRVPSAFYITGQINIQRVRYCLGEIIRRHEILRTSFHYEEGETFQLVHSDFMIPLEVIDLQEDELDSVVQKFYQPFELSKFPLCRFGIIKLKDDKHLFLIDMHHIVSDGMSIVIFQKEFIDLYLGKELEPLNMQYKDFCAWSRTTDYSVLMNKQEKYWLDEFSDNVPVLKMPLDFQRPKFDTFEGKMLSFNLDQVVTKKLYKLSIELRSTLFMLLLSVYKVALYKYTGQTDLVVGTPVLGRNHPGTRNIIGMFLNFVPIRTKINEKESFLEFSNQVKRKTIGAFDNQHYPIERIVDRLQHKIHHVPGQNPLYSTMFIMDNMLKQEIEIEGLKISEYQLRDVASILDFHIEAAEKNGAIELKLIYNKNLFTEEMMLNFGNKYMNLIEEIISNPNNNIVDFEDSIQENEASILSFNEEIF